jgi:protein-arginine kinase activator protein McsA
MTKKKTASQRWLDKKMESDTFRVAYEEAGKDPYELSSQETDNINRFIFINLRKLINPLKMCDTCINEWTNFTAKEEKLCDECYKHKYLKNK